jgi:hypothetical protein
MHSRKDIASLPPSREAAHVIADTARQTTARLDCLKAAGAQGVIRYYARTTAMPEKRLTRGEAQAIIAAGLPLAVVHQAANNSPEAFSHQRGVLEGAHSRNVAATEIGQPDGSAIYFAVDYDASEAELRDRIIPYFQGVQQAFAASPDLPEYRVGAYGSGLVCRTLLDRRLADFAWLSQSTGHREHAAFKASRRWSLSQGPSRQLCGISLDPNDWAPEFGQFTRLDAVTVAADGVLERPEATGASSGMEPAGAVIGDPDGFDHAAFVAFVEAQGFRFFKPYELLVKGDRHDTPGSRCHGLNTHPPRRLWPNIVRTVHVLDRLRAQLGAAIRIDSAYRAAAYNACIGGADNSAHMTFHAVDFRADGSSRPVDWARALRNMRDTEALFAGGVGLYRSFVHLDTNGVNRDW